jgi:hypothetical protein
MKTIQVKQIIHRIDDDVFIINNVLETPYENIFQNSKFAKYRITDTAILCSFQLQ